jgi:type III pantothenate kinase
MMASNLLAIDAGNTNTVFAVFADATIRGRWRVATRVDRTADEYAATLGQLLAIAGLEPRTITAAIISSVVPAGLFALKVLCRDYFRCEPMLVDSSVDFGVKVLVDNPCEVGADRLVNAVGACLDRRGPLIVIDFGTATTFDVVDEDGNYCGGVIAPGINLALEALHQAAATLPRIAVGRPPTVIGKSTVPAMQSGVYWGYVGLIEGLVERVKAEYARPMGVVATGGLAPLFEAATPVIEHLDLDLTIRGLREIHRRTTQGRHS